jgi:hypothetical protein
LPEVKKLFPLICPKRTSALLVRVIISPGTVGPVELTETAAPVTNSSGSGGIHTSKCSNSSGYLGRSPTENVKLLTVTSRSAAVATL